MDLDSCDQSESGRLVPITVREFSEDLTVAGYAALGDDKLVFLMIPTAVEPSSEFELGAAFGEEAHRQKVATYVHQNLAPEFMSVVFSIESIRSRLEKENHPCVAELKAIEQQITGPLQRMREEIKKSDADQREYYLMSRLLTAIVENSDDAVISKDLNGIVTSWNRGAERIFGYTADEMIGTSIRRIIPQDRQKEEDEILAHLRRGERRDHFETVRTTKDGRQIYVSLTISPIKDETGQVIGASKIARAVADRISAEVAFSDAPEKADPHRFCEASKALEPPNTAGLIAERA
ncbi:MAG: MEKHLA domain-containing protein [Verrucomicrobia bacterium]|nr:MEKHLA domain-containing protein [Verrucomicrobiota bacterium]